jgi:hypothetical protein
LRLFGNGSGPKTQKNVENQIIALYKGLQKVGEFESLELAKNAMHEIATSGLNVFTVCFCERTETGTLKIIAGSSECIRK